MKFKVNLALLAMLATSVAISAVSAADVTRLAPEELASTAESETIEKRSKIPSSNSDYLTMIRKATLQLEKNPKNAGAYLDLAYANRHLGNYQKCLDYSNKSISLEPDVAVAYAERGLGYSGLKKFDKALDDMSTAIKLDENNSAFYSHRGWIYIILKKYDLAVRECTRSIEIYGDYSPAFYARGRAYLALNQYEKAIADFSSAIKLFPNEVGGYYTDRAYAYIQLKQYPRALSDLLIGMRIDPDDSSAFLFKAIALSKTGAQQEALVDLNKAIAINAKNIPALSNRGILYRLSREFEKSCDDFKTAIALSPDSAVLHRELGLTYLVMNQSDLALVEFERAVSLDPDEYESAYQAAYARLRAKGDFKLAYDNSKDKTAVVETSTNKKVTFFIDQLVGSATEQKAMLAKIVKQVETLSPTEHLPPSENFKLFMERDLAAFFKGRTKKTLQVDYQLLRDVPTLTLNGKPAFYCWAKAAKMDQIIEEGAVRLEAADKKGFVVTDYLSTTDIAGDSKLVFKSFPEIIAVDIFYRAKVKPAEIPGLESGTVSPE